MHNNCLLQSSSASSSLAVTVTVAAAVTVAVADAVAALSLWGIQNVCIAYFVLAFWNSAKIRFWAIERQIEAG